MRIAVLSDIHGNRTAFEAVLADLKQTCPDLILHGGDLTPKGKTYRLSGEWDLLGVRSDGAVGPIYAVRATEFSLLVRP
jgi:predicted phosphodiesterase